MVPEEPQRNIGRSSNKDRWGDGILFAHGVGRQKEVARPKTSRRVYLAIGLHVLLLVKLIRQLQPHAYCTWAWGFPSYNLENSYRFRCTKVAFIIHMHNSIRGAHKTGSMRRMRRIYYATTGLPSKYLRLSLRYLSYLVQYSFHADGRYQNVRFCAKRNAVSLFRREETKLI